VSKDKLNEFFFAAFGFFCSIVFVFLRLLRFLLSKSHSEFLTEGNEGNEEKKASDSILFSASSALSCSTEFAFLFCRPRLRVGL
jgi:hypothetical protein